MANEPRESSAADQAATTKVAAEREATGQPKKQRRKRSIRRNMSVGAVIGASFAVVVLLILTVLVIVQAFYSAVDPAGTTNNAFTVAGFLFAFVCFGLPAIVICALIGAAAGLIRARM